MQRHDVAWTLRLRCINVMCPLGSYLAYVFNVKNDRICIRTLFSFWVIRRRLHINKIHKKWTPFQVCPKNWTSVFYYPFPCLNCWMSCKQCRCVLWLWSGSALFVQVCLFEYTGKYGIIKQTRKIHNIAIAWKQFLKLWSLVSVLRETGILYGSFSWWMYFTMCETNRSMHTSMVSKLFWCVFSLSLPWFNEKWHVHRWLWPVYLTHATLASSSDMIAVMI